MKNQLRVNQFKINLSMYGLSVSIKLLTDVFFSPWQRVLRVLRAVPHHRPRHRSQPVRVAGVHICGDDHLAGLRAVVGGSRHRHHRHDPGQHVRRHVAVEHQPQRGVPGEPGHGEETH